MVAHACLQGAGNVTISAAAYLKKAAEEVLPKPLDKYPKYATPADRNLQKNYDAAVLNRQSSREEHADLCVSYPSKVGKLVYAMPACRADCAHCIGMLTRCLTFPTPEMDAAADRCLIYMAQTADQGITWSDAVIRPELHAYVDSDWQVDCSTSGLSLIHI